MFIVIEALNKWMCLFWSPCSITFLKAFFRVLEEAQPVVDLWPEVSAEDVGLLSVGSRTFVPNTPVGFFLFILAFKHWRQTWKYIYSHSTMWDTKAHNPVLLPQECFWAPGTDTSDGLVLMHRVCKFSSCFPKKFIGLFSKEMYNFVLLQMHLSSY